MIAEAAKIRGRFTLRKYASDEDFRAGKSYAEESFDNLLTTVGLQALGRLLTAQGSVTPFSNANAYLGVGDSSTAAAVGQTDLQASTNKVRVAMDATYPTDPTNGAWVFRSTFGSSVGNFAWAEFAIFNASTSGIMLNRAVSAQGTKTSGQTWTLTLTLTVS